MPLLRRTPGFPCLLVWCTGARRLLASAALGSLASCGLVMAQTGPTFQVNPLPTAPSARYAPGGVSKTNPLETDPDVRIRQLSPWLREKVAPLAEAQRAAAAKAGNLTAEARRQEALVKLRRSAGGDLKIQFRPQNGTAMFIRGALQTRAAQGNVAKAGVLNNLDESTARAFLRENRVLLQIEDPDQELVLTSIQTDELARKHLRFAQFYRGLPVWPCELIVHLDPAGNADLLNGAYIPTPRGVAIEPALRREQVKDAVTLVLPNADPAAMTDPELIVYGPLDQPSRLAWKLEVSAGATALWQVVIDALDGSLIARNNLVKEAAVSGSGADGRGNSRALDLWQDGSTYYMVNTSKSMFDPTSQPPAAGRGVILIYNAGDKEVQDPQFSAGLVTSANLSSGWDPDAVGAAYGLSETYEYYLERFGRNSLDGLGGNIRAIVRFGQNVANAFWYPTTKTMVFGFGFTREIDISGHELTHGVMDSIGNGGILEYKNQSGALNESMADIFGEMVEARNKGGEPDWLKADPFEPGNRSKLLQDYANPTSVSQFPGRPNPSKMSEFAQLSIEQDNGGVHINSCIINTCFYQLAKGMPDALGMGDAERVFYRAMTTHLQKQSQFIDMRLACVTAAEEIFGADSAQAQRTRQAFDLVEIIDSPNTPTPSPIPEIQAPDSTLFLRFEPFFGGVVLGRREAALGDDLEGVMLDTADFVAPKRLSVSGDGQYAVFVSADNDIGVLATDGSELEFADVAGAIHAAALAPNGILLALVLIDPLTQFPDNEIVIIDLRDFAAERIPLLAPVADGAAQDIVLWADAMDFHPDGTTLIYDAISEIPAAGGSFTGWTLFAVDLIDGTISTIINLNDGLDFGNPSLGNVRNHLLTHEVIDKKTGISSIYAVDLQNGTANRIATLAQANVIGFPAYTGDDRAIIYSQVDLSVATTVSLVRQELAEDGITPVGQPTLWLPDADYAAIYRRGAFIPTNSLPQVSLTSPTSGQTFTAPASLNLAVNAVDPDGTIASVQFFVGSTMISEDTSAPYTSALTIESAPSGAVRLTARAIDNLGGAADSAPVDVTVTDGVGAPITISAQPQSQTVAAGSNVTLSVTATGGRGPLTYRWRRNGVDLESTSSTLQLLNVIAAASGDYTVVVSDGTESVTSAPATLTVTGEVPGNAVRLQAKLLGGGLVQLAIQGGKVNDVLRIQASQDLKTWATISTLISSGGQNSFVDAETPGLKARFYRVTSSPN